MIPSTVSLAGEESLRRIADLAALKAKNEVEIRQTVMGCAAIMEFYVDSVVEKMVEMSGVASNAVGTAMLREVEQDLGRNWSRRNYWFGVATGSAFAGEAYGQEASTLVDLRNALAHGTGGVSRLQSRDPDGGVALRKQFAERLEVRSIGGTLLVVPATARRATLISRHFVLSLDSRFVQQGSAATINSFAR